MRINSITVGGFKNLKKTKLNLDNITILLSQNNYGKSNLFEAIDFGMSFMNESRKGRKGMMSWAKGIPICKTLQDENYYFEIEIEDESLKEYKYIKYGYTFAWYRDDDNGAKITNEWIESRESKSIRYTSFLKRKEGKYKKNKITASFKKIEIDEYQLAIDVLRLLEDEISILAKTIQSCSFRMCSSLDLGDRFQPTPFEYIEDNDDLLRFDDDDVPKALSLLKKKSPESYESFEDAIFTLFPEFTSLDLQEYTLKQDNVEVVAINSSNENNSDTSQAEIPFKIKEHIYRLFVKSSYLNQAVPMANMSTGTKRVIWLLTNAFISNYLGTGVIGIEEIETSIHPRLIKSLLEIISETINDTPLIISSHSPYLAQYFKMDKIYIGMPNDEGIAVFKKIQSSKVNSLIKNAKDIGLTVGEYIFELLSGDDDSYRILNGYLED